MKSIFFLFIFISANSILWGQANDTLYLHDLFRFVRATHPIVKQSLLLNQTAQQELRLARGAFDPSIDLHFNRKDLWNYKENWQPATYFESWQHFFKIPVWIGDVKFGFERYNGINVNPENFTPPQGLGYVEFNIPLSRGLTMDNRRVAVLQAKEMINMNEAERQKIVNKLLYQIAKDYYLWNEYHQKLEIQKKTYNLALDRLLFVKDRVLVGDLAPIDSIEASTEVQKRFLSFRETEMAAQNAKQLLSVHLWDQEERPLEIAENIVPQTFQITNHKPNLAWLDSLQSIASQAHPEIVKLNAKQRVLNLDIRLKRQELLPLFDFDLKPFFLPATNDPKIELHPNYGNISYWAQNYKFGFNLYMPIFLRKERAKLEKAKIKLLENTYDITYTQRNVLTQIFTHYNEVNTFHELTNAQARNVIMTRQLFEAEIERFKNGESSLFLINSRERSFLSEQEKYIELQMKYLKSFAGAIYHAGQPLDNR